MSLITQTANDLLQNLITYGLNDCLKAVLAQSDCNHDKDS